MAFHSLVLWAVVICVGVPSAWRNPTAAALVLAKIAGWGWSKITGNSLPTDFYLFPDLFVMAVIFAKPEYAPCQRYKSVGHQLACFALERSPADRAVMLIFVVSWVLYVSPIHPYFVWWLLWSGVILQFLFASAESLEIYWRGRAVGKSVFPIIDRHLVVIHQRREADAVRKTPEFSGALLTVNGGGGGG